MIEHRSPKSEKFWELRSKRVPKAIKAIQLVGNLANRGNYDFTEQEAIEIILELQTAIDDLAKAYRIPVNPVDKSPAIDHQLAQIYADDAKPEIEQLEAGNPSTWWIKWALDCINRGQFDDAKEHLKTALGRKESEH